MPNELTHAVAVNAWLDRCTQSTGTEQLVDEFGSAFNALWRRAHRTLGDMTLMAIGNRVLSVAQERYPFLSQVFPESNGIHLDPLRRNAAQIQFSQLQAAVHFTLTEFLQVLGHLTAEILTPALHAELAGLGRSAPTSNPTETDEATEGTE